MNKEASIVQKYFKGYVAKKRFFEIVEKMIRLQAFFRGVQARKQTKKAIEAIIILQSFARMVNAKHQLFQLKMKKNVSKYHAHRTNVVKEILATEETYVKDLENVMRVPFLSSSSLPPSLSLSLC